MTIGMSKIGHCTKSRSDKVYVVTTYKSPSKPGDEIWVVMAQWGPRGRAPMSSQVKGSYPSRVVADQAAQDVWRAKARGGYEDIDRADYRGPVTRESLKALNWLMVDDDGDVPESEPVPVPDTVVVSRTDMRVTCVNNVGVLDRFRLHEQYVAESHEHSDMLWVWDENGERRECFADRFEVVSGSVVFEKTLRR